VAQEHYLFIISISLYVLKFFNFKKLIPINSNSKKVRNFLLPNEIKKEECNKKSLCQTVF